MLGTIQRAGLVLDLFSVEAPVWGATAVAGELGISKSQAHEVMTSLTAIGLLQRAESGRFQLGWRIVAMGSVLVRGNDLKAEAPRIMRGLVSRLGETVHLAVWDRGSIAYIEKVEGTNSVRIAVSTVGARLPGHGSGVGKVILAHRSAEEVDEMLERDGMQAFTPRTITTPAGLKAELERVRARGYAMDREEHVPEVCCVAAPVYDARGDVIAALSMSFPSYRLQARRDDYTRAVLDATERITQTLRNLHYMRAHGHPTTSRENVNSSRVGAPTTEVLA